MSIVLTNSQFSSADGVTSLAIPAFSSPLTNPSLIVALAIVGGTLTPTAPTDTAGNSYVDCGAGKVAGNGAFVQIFYALNTHTTASNIVTFNATGTAAFMQGTAGEFTGCATASPVDVTKSNANATGGSPSGNDVLTSTSATTTADGDLIVGQVNAGGTPSHGVSPNTFTDLGFSGNGGEYFIQTTHGSIAATWGDNVAFDAYGAIMAAFKAASTALTQGWWQQTNEPYPEPEGMVDY